MSPSLSDVEVHVPRVLESLTWQLAHFTK
jgi:hypothetical protein